jgi:hypothetical protein
LRHIFFFVYAVHDLFQILFFVYDIWVHSLTTSFVVQL